VLNTREKTQNKLHLVSKLFLQALELSTELKGPIPKRHEKSLLREHFWKGATLHGEDALQAAWMLGVLHYLFCMEGWMNMRDCSGCHAKAWEYVHCFGQC